MSRLSKAKERIVSKPRDYTYTELKVLLGQLGFEESSKGKTSGSRVKFYRESDKRIILLHKPHPGDIIDPGALKDIVDTLLRLGELR